MFNPVMGAPRQSDGRTFIRTEPGRAGHAVYGPYATLEAGDYAVEFTLARSGVEPDKGLCAVLDVARDQGNETLARQELRGGDLDGEPRRFILTFAIDRPSQVEYRVYVSGAATLEIDGYRPVARLAGADTDAEAALAALRFPDVSGAPFFEEHGALLRQLSEQGVGVARDGDGAILTINGIRFNARTRDDVNFVGELFFENAYNFTLGRDACVIDIGMNIGLASLQFAAKPQVKRVVSFEPFVATYERAAANIALNPALAAKIEANNCGLGDRDEERAVTVAQSTDSGAMSTIDVAGGMPIPVRLRDAAGAIGPIVADARAKGQAVIVKVDCEGSEFAIFESLERAGLLGEISAFLVEWHAMFAGKTAETLIAPLRRHGFVIFDRSPPSGNGFFYAARIA